MRGSLLYTPYKRAPDPAAAADALLNSILADHGVDRGEFEAFAEEIAADPARLERLQLAIQNRAVSLQVGDISVHTEELVQPDPPETEEP